MLGTTHFTGKRGPSDGRGVKYGLKMGSDCQRWVISEKFGLPAEVFELRKGGREKPFEAHHPEGGEEQIGF